MARPRSEDKREALMAAATRIIAAQGLSAPTALIAKEAGVANGSLFNYFPTKAALLNELYREIKTEMAAASLRGIDPNGELREQLFRLWMNGLTWTTSFPEKRRALAHLGVSDDITEESRQAGHVVMAGVAHLLDRSRQNGPLRDAPLGFVVSLMSAVSESAVEFMNREPERADEHCRVAFEALWRMVR